MAKSILLLLLSAAIGATAADIKAMAVQVHDGDTFTAYNAVDRRTIQVRLFAADAPECGQGQIAEQAKRTLASLLAGKDLVLTKKGQSWQRVVYKVTIMPRTAADKPTDASAALILAGVAFRDPRFDKKKEYASFEAAARAAHNGIWEPGVKVEQPWVWRKSNRPRRGDGACSQ